MKRITKYIFLLFIITIACNIKSVYATTISELSIDFESPNYGDILANDRHDIYYTATEGLNFYYDESHWEKYDNNTNSWIKKENREDMYALSGKYRYIECYYVNGEEYELAEDFKVKVNNQLWNNFSIKKEGDFRYIEIVMPEVNMTTPVGNELVFFDSVYYDITEYVYSNESITQFSIAKNVDGGTKPYLFKKVSGPEWLVVSEDGIISGTPNSLNDNYKIDNGDAIIKVTDSNNQSKTITINCGTTIDRSKLTIIDKIDIPNFNTPRIGNFLYNSSLLSNTILKTSTVDIFYYNYTSNDLNEEIKPIYSKVNSNVSKYNKQGIYRHIIKAIIANSKGYRITKNTKVLLNNELLKTTYHETNNGSYLEILLPIYKVTEKTIILYEINYKPNCPTNSELYFQNILVHPGKKLKNTESPTCEGYRFLGWFTDEQLKTKFDNNKNITSNTTLYGKWINSSIKTDISQTEITGITNKEYNGKYQTQSLKIKHDNYVLKNGTDYQIAYKNNKNIGTATITIMGKDPYYKGKITKTFKITKKNNPMTVKTKTKTIKYKKVVNKQQIVAPIKVNKVKGTIAYKKISGKKKFKVNSKTGKITVKKGTKKGIYEIKVKVTAKGNSTYSSKTQTVTIKIKVK